MLTSAALTNMSHAFRAQLAAATATLNEWDEDWWAFDDRQWGLFGRQLANRVLVRDLKARITNPQPEIVHAHIVIWRGSHALFWTDPVYLGPDDWLEVDLSTVEVG